MTPGQRPRARSAAGAAAAIVVGVVTVAALGMVLYGYLLTGAEGSGLPLVVEQVPGVAASCVAVILLVRRPRHGVGWALAAVGLCSAVSGAGQALGDWWLSVPRSNVQPVLWSELVSQVAGAASIGFLGVVLPLIFPTGAVPSARWRPVLTAALVLIASGTIAYPLVPDTITRGGVEIGTTPVVVPALAQVATIVGTASFAGVLLLVPVAVASVLVRFRRSTGIERQQMRWFTYAITVGGVALAALFVLAAAENVGIVPRAPDALVDAVLLVPLTALPVTIGTAVLRYRLYDLDRLVSRTVGYSILTLALLSLYAGLVLTAQAIVGPDDAPDIVVAGATLAVAALFGPLRSRVQRAVDRRFDRRSYDAVRLTEAFGHRLRDEVAMDAVVDELRTAAVQAVRPDGVWLWLPGSAETPP